MDNLNVNNPTPNGLQESSENATGFIYHTYSAVGGESQMITVPEPHEYEEWRRRLILDYANCNPSEECVVAALEQLWGSDECQTRVAR